MKNKYKIKASIILVLMSVVLISNTNILNIKASENQEVMNYNLETMQKIDRDDYIRNIFKAIYNKDITYIQNNTALFTEDCYDKLIQYIETSNINSNNISDTVIDSITVENSSTGDFVIMLNTKIWYENQEYNKLYLTEFHINANGRVYGYNIWVY